VALGPRNGGWRWGGSGPWAKAEAVCGFEEGGWAGTHARVGAMPSTTCSKRGQWHRAFEVDGGWVCWRRASSRSWLTRSWEDCRCQIAENSATKQQF